jgi:hypothetical protein
VSSKYRARAIDVGIDGVIGIKEVLAVKAQRAVASGQQGKHQLIGVGGRGTPHFLHHWRVDADVVVLDVNTRHAHRALVQLVGQAVARGRHVFHDPRSRPLAQFGELTQPAIGVAGGGAGDVGGDFGPMRGRVAQAVLKNRGHARAQTRQQGGCDDGHV